MTNPLDTAAAKPLANLIEFGWGDPMTWARYAIWPREITFAGDDYEAVPGMEARLDRRDGGTKDAKLTLTVPTSILPIANMRQTHPEVRVTMWEMNPADVNTAEVLHMGVVELVEFNYSANGKVARVTVSGRKARLASSLSLRIGRFCPWTLGRSPCLYNRDANKETVQVVSRDGNKVTVTGLLQVNNPLLWKFGGVRRDGLEISIHAQITGEQTIYTVKPIPSSWVGQFIDVLPGCDKVPTTCTVRGQIARFGGMGVKIADRDVRYEE